MEQEESTKQASIQFRCRKIASFPAASEVMKTDGDQDSRKSLESPTPNKLESRSIIKGLGSSPMKGKQLFEDFQLEKISPESTKNVDSSKKIPSVDVASGEDDSIELPEEYKMLSALFERMISSIRLLALRKRLPTFRNISTQVEILSKRKFLCRHLAQMKYALPEALLIEKILIHDERSLCMIPDMKVTLVWDPVERRLHPDQSASATLCKAFRESLLDFFKSHPEGADIPQALLPEPFNPESHVAPIMLSLGSFRESPQENSLDLVLSRASHFPLSFDHQFSLKIIPEKENVEKPAFPAPLLSKDAELRNSPQIDTLQSSVSSVRSPAGVICTPSHMTPQSSEFAPSKHSSIGNAFITETPSLQTPKRPLAATNEKSISEDEELVSEPKSANSVRRSLIFDSSNVDESLSELDSYTSLQDGVHPRACGKTTRSERSFFVDDIVGSPTNQEASDTAASVSEIHNTSQAGEDKCNDSRGCLLGIFDTICHILRSTDCSLITKEELVHKIILNNLDIEGTREVEEQLQLLEELVPDWLSKKAASNGDCFYCIKQAYDRESVRLRLVEAA